MSEMLLARKALKRARLSCDGFMKVLKEVVANGWNPEDNLEILDQMTQAMGNFIKCYDDVIVLHDDGVEDEQKDIDAKDKAMVDYLRVINEFKSYKKRFKVNWKEVDHNSISKIKDLDNEACFDTNHDLQTEPKVEMKYEENSAIEKRKGVQGDKLELIDVKVEIEKSIGTATNKSDPIMDMEVNSQNLKIFTCHICMNSFKMKTILTRHLKTHIKKELRPVVGTCLVCDKSFYSTKSFFNKHMKNCSKETVDSKRNGPKCDGCMKTFTSKKSLIAHLKTHVDKEQRPIVGKCLVCDKTFYSNKQVLNVHMKKCSKEKIERKRMHKLDIKQCNQCEYSSRFFKNLKRHVEKVHNKKPKKTNCDNCDYSSLKPYQLRAHIENRSCQKKEEREKLLSTLRNSHFCDYYSKRPNRMRKHIEACKRVKEREQVEKVKHICANCGKQFNSKGNLEIHEQSHLKIIEAPLQCQLCLNFFKTKEFLENHLENHSTFEKTYAELSQGRVNC